MIRPCNEVLTACITNVSGSGFGILKCLYSEHDRHPIYLTMARPNSLGLEASRCVMNTNLGRYCEVPQGEVDRTELMAAVAAGAGSASFAYISQMRLVIAGEVRKYGSI